MSNDEPDAQAEIEDGELQPFDDGLTTAEHDAALIQAARRRHGTFGAGLAGAMLGLDQALFDRVKPDHVQVQEAPTEPEDVDEEGITVELADDAVAMTPALPRKAPIINAKRRRRSS